MDQEVRLGLQECLFTNNTASSIAGVLYISHTSNLAVLSSQFYNNSAPNAGAFFVTMGASFSIVNSHFEGHHS